MGQAIPQVKTNIEKSSSTEHQSIQEKYHILVTTGGGVAKYGNKEIFYSVSNAFPCRSLKGHYFSNTSREHTLFKGERVPFEPALGGAGNPEEAGEPSEPGDQYFCEF